MHLDGIKQIEQTQPFDFLSQIRDASAFNFQGSMCIVVPEGNGRGTHALQNEHTGAVHGAVLLSDSARSSVLYMYNCCPELQGPSKCPMAGSLALR